MSVKVGTTDIATVGKVKLGTTNITKVYQGSTQIWPVNTYYTRLSSNGSVTQDGACSIPGGLSTTYYIQTPIDRVFTNISLTTPLNGLNKWYVFSDYNVVQIDTNGYIVDYYDGCIF